MHLKYFSIVLFICLGFGNAPAQTKKIAYKSHSGSMENYQTALEENLFDMGSSNFGMAPEPFIQHAKLDSVICISENISIMVTSEYCIRKYRRTHSKSDTSIWKAGRDTVYHHPIFSKRLSTDSMRKILDHEYYFRNPASEVVFTGFNAENYASDSTKYASTLHQNTSGPGHSSNSGGSGTTGFPFSILMMTAICMMAVVLIPVISNRQYQLMKMA